MPRIFSDGLRLPGIWNNPPEDPKAGVRARSCVGPDWMHCVRNIDSNVNDNCVEESVPAPATRTKAQNVSEIDKLSAISDTNEGGELLNA